MSRFFIMSFHHTQCSALSRSTAAVLSPRASATLSRIWKFELVLDFDESHQWPSICEDFSLAVWAGSSIPLPVLVRKSAFVSCQVCSEWGLLSNTGLTSETLTVSGVAWSLPRNHLDQSLHREFSLSPIANSIRRLSNRSQSLGLILSF